MEYSDAEYNELHDDLVSSIEALPAGNSKREMYIDMLMDLNRQMAYDSLI
jgi:hypothetical protein|tara:strand:- start:1591 stop:1740 length:150 start_codon:yes stop_codon:yes gene_type:complete